MYNDPIAFFFTISTYGTWLPGDSRGWVEYKSGWQLPDPIVELEACAEMSEDACVLNQTERAIVEEQLMETCDFRGWTLHAKNCRSNHMHYVIGGEATPKKIRIDTKAWCTRRLKRDSRQRRENWWTERGSVRWVYNEDGLATVIEYVNEAQDRKYRDHLS